MFVDEADEPQVKSEVAVFLDSIAPVSDFLGSDYPFDTTAKWYREVREWSACVQTMEEFWSECPNVNWLIFAMKDKGYAESWREIACQSVRDELWPFLQVSKEGVIGGEVGGLKEQLGSGWHVRTKGRDIIYKVEEYCRPGGKKVDLTELQSFAPLLPYWNLHSLAMNACHSVASRYPRHGGVQSLEYTQKAVGLLAVLNVLGKVPMAGEETIWSQVDKGMGKVYEGAVKGCQQRQSDILRKKLSCPKTWRR